MLLLVQDNLTTTMHEFKNESFIEFSCTVLQEVLVYSFYVYSPYYQHTSPFFSSLKRTFFLGAPSVKYVSLVLIEGEKFANSAQIQGPILFDPCVVLPHY